MRIPKSFALLLLGSMTAVSAQDDGWSYADPNEWIVVATAGTGSVWRLRSSDVANESNNNPQVWVTIDHSNDKTVRYRQSKRLILFDCLGGRSKSISSITYRADGTVIDSYSPSYSTFEYMAPGTVIESTAQSACPTKK